MYIVQDIRLRNSFILVWHRQDETWYIIISFQLIVHQLINKIHTHKRQTMVCSTNVLCDDDDEDDNDVVADYAEVDSDVIAVLLSRETLYSNCCIYIINCKLFYV